VSLIRLLASFLSPFICLAPLAVMHHVHLRK
jgi:hypothetical protein